MTLGEAVIKRLHPGSWSFYFPGGYRTICKVVSKSNVALGAGNEAISCNFGETPSGKKGPVSPKVSYTYFSEAQEWVKFLHTLFHEHQHCSAEWSGFYHEELLQKMEA